MKIRSPFLNRLLARTAVLLVRLLFMTVRTEVRFLRPETSCYDEPPDDKRYAYCLWHDGIVLASFGRTPRNCAIVVSQHRDGGLLATALESLGMRPIRGSSSKGGARAVRRVMEETADLHFTITPDGPRGPRREVKDGIIFLASRTRHPLVPTCAVSRRSWAIKGSWTDMAMPAPFTRCVLLAGDPIEVPEDLPRERLPEFRDRLQKAMDQMDQVGQHYVKTGVVDFTVGQAASPEQSRAAA